MGSSDQYKHRRDSSEGYTHTSKKLKEWVHENKEQIVLHYLSSYSPYVNPDEHVNDDVKNGVGEQFPKRIEREFRYGSGRTQENVTPDPTAYHEVF